MDSNGPETFTFGDIEYRIIPIENCVAVGRQLHERQANWHIHVLSPGCRYNPFSDFYCMVIEDNDQHIAYLATSVVFPEADKILVRLLHGDAILDSPPDCRHESALNSSAVKLVEELQENQHAWHHHMHFPDCMLNPEPGRWAISIESESVRHYEIYDAEPTGPLNVIESIYFSATGHP